MNIIQFKGKTFVIKNKELQNDQLWFIIHNLDKGFAYEYILNMSYIYINHKQYKLIYEPHIMSALSELTQY